MILNNKKNKTMPDRDRALDSVQTESRALSGERGYAILELLFYIALFSILSLVVIEAMITMAQSFKETAIQAELAQSGTIMERMSREIRQANNISSISATDLVLNIGSGTSEFKFISSNIQFWQNGSSVGNLNSLNIVVTGLTFTQIITTKGKAVKIALSVRSSNDSAARIFDFYDTIVLRGAY